MPLGDTLFYHPNTTLYEAPGEYGLDYESVSFRADDGPLLHGWFFPATGRPAGTVLHLHGNAGNVTGHFPFIAWLPAAGWNVLCFDYRGYGQSEGKVTRPGTIADANAALDYLLTRPDVNTNGIVAFGQSLGGAVGIVLTAQRKEIRGLAADGAFDHYRQVAAWTVRQNPILFAIGWWVPRFLIGDGYDPIDYVARIAPRPLFIMHGTADTIVPVEAAQRLHNAAGHPKELWLVDGADHYQAINDTPEETHPRLLSFFERCVGA